MRNYVAIPFEYLNTMRVLSDSEFGRLVRGLVEYAANGKPLALKGRERMFADYVISQEQRFQESYTEAKKTKSKAGKAGSSARWTEKSDENEQISMADDNRQWQTMADDGKNGNTNTNTETNNNTHTDVCVSPQTPQGAVSHAPKRFVPPTVAEVRAYCFKHNIAIDAERFVDYHTSRGWVVGRAPMKDWEAAVRTWAKNERENQRPANPPVENRFADYV